MHEDPNLQPTTFTVGDRLLLHKLVDTTNSTIQMLKDHLIIDTEYKKCNDDRVVKIETEQSVVKSVFKIVGWTIGIIGTLTGIALAFNLI